MVWMFWILPMHTEVALHSMNAYVWCWRKAYGSLDEISSVTMGTCKRKFLLNSNMTLTVLNLHQQTDPKVQQDFTARVNTARSKVNQCRTMTWAHLKPSTNVPTKYKLPTPYSLWDITWTRFYRSRSLQQGQRSNQGQTMTWAHLKPSTNVPTKYKLPTPYSLWDITWTRFYRSRSLQQGQRSNQGHMT